jgi:hypothetical protein
MGQRDKPLISLRLLLELCFDAVSAILVLFVIPLSNHGFIP